VMSDVKGIPAFLDRIVEKANDIHYKGDSVSPYLAMDTFGKLASLLLIAALSLLFDEFVWWKCLLLFVSVAFLYGTVYVGIIKKRLLRSVSKSYLQDTVLFIIPISLGVIWLLGIPLRAGFDMVGLILPVMLTFKRIGCFLGGCCFGLPSRFGVLYSRKVIDYYPNERKNNPNLVPQTRVFPIQLVEAFVNLALFVWLFVRLIVNETLAGDTLLLYLFVYSAYRFIADFFRTSSVRPRIGRWSEAQLVSAILFLLCLGIYVLK